MKVAFQMEHLSETIKGENNTLLLIEEACRRNHEVFHYHPDTVSLDNDNVYAWTATLEVDQSGDPWYRLGEYRKTKLSSFDMIWFRQDPPFDISYITNTYMLDFLKARHVRVINNPFWIRNTPDKLSIFDFSEYLPPTLVSRDHREISAFFEKHQDVVIKPVYGFHGHGVVRTSSFQEAIQQLELYHEPLMFQPFLKEILDGNKRLVFFDGKFVGAIKTVIPDESEFRIYRGSEDLAYTPTAGEMAFCERIGPVLKERGLDFVGVDFIGPYLMEINTGSVGSLVRMNSVYGRKFEAELWDIIENGN